MKNPSRIVIDVVGLGKRYRVQITRAEPSLMGTLQAAGLNFAAALRSPTALRSQKYRELWALREISFQVERGEVVGIVGNNGAGKSTLLKILSRITEPTTGSIDYCGRVGSLLEVGTGFHPDLTGRENVFLNGAILGMRRRDIARRFDEIVTFAGVEQFIDVPIKRYSSGMYLRLAFAVSAHLDTDILLFDEVLAVGDLNFQKKCLLRMGEVARDGRTILFVSHNLTAIKALCKRTLVLKDGTLEADGNTSDVLADYLKSSISSAGEATVRQWPEGDAPKNDTIRMISATVSPVGGAPTDPVDVTMSFVVEWCFRNLVHGVVLNSSLLLKDQQGLLLFEAGPWDPQDPLAAGVYRSSCSIPGYLLNDGSYSFSLVFRCKDEILLELPNILQLEILDHEEGRHGWFGKWEGLLRPRLPWTTKRLEGDDLNPSGLDRKASADRPGDAHRSPREI
jgi:lipopolysaccharide transport system ATP-binding protein